MFEKSKPIVEYLFVEEIKGKLKEGKTVEFIKINQEKFYIFSVKYELVLVYYYI